MDQGVEIMREIYPEIEARVMHLIARHASVLARKTLGEHSFRDSLQLGREIAWKSLFKYDVNRAQGEIGPYINRCLRNACAETLRKSLARRRLPFVHTRHLDGGHGERPLPPIQMSAIPRLWDWHSGTSMWESTTLDPFDEADEAYELEQNLDEVRKSLNELQCFVLDMMIDPPPELIDIHDSLGEKINGPISQVAFVEWLYPMVDRHQLQKAMSKIRQVIMKHVEKGGFSDSFHDHVLRGWTKLGAMKRKGARETK